MVKDIKIAICGKYGAGKDTLASIIKDCVHYAFDISKSEITSYSFADPGKDMLLRMYPEAHSSSVYGSSSRRNEKIPGLDHVTYRMMLKILLQSPKALDPDIWVNMMARKIDYAKHAIITDLRFFNEMKMLKEKKFFLIGIKRGPVLCDPDYDQLPESEFDLILDNTGSPHDLEVKTESLVRSWVK